MRCPDAKLWLWPASSSQARPLSPISLLLHCKTPVTAAYSDIQHVSLCCATCNHWASSAYRPTVLRAEIQPRHTAAQGAQHIDVRTRSSGHCNYERDVQ